MGFRFLLIGEFMKKPQLLAPAGNMECLYSAINAGADAIYLAGKQFGARAGATNFTEEELIYAITLAHLHGVKIYLTLNTLIKEREWNLIRDFVMPLYTSGLDAVIIQDLGLIDYLKDEFPGLELHASTQMTVTGQYGARLLKEKGLHRIVPARELSLEEISSIKESCDIELETFIHGAECYCYSGQCLFSSFLGGRSGNRGRCAGPCRLPYTITQNGKYIKKDNIKYPISLKDMCTLTCIDKLIDCGIDSFKIEGRLKSPEYVAGVTSIYRKYIDLYCETKDLNIEPKDLDILSNLYIRSQLNTGYYTKHNGPDMITALTPSYSETDEAVAAMIRNRFVFPVKKLPVNGIITLVPGQRTSIILRYGEHIITCEGSMVDRAQNRPITAEDVSRQLNKTGDSFYYFEHLDIEIEDNCFMPLKSLNELRRNSFDMLTKELVKANE